MRGHQTKQAGTGCRTSGFTLIELIVVITVLGVLATIAVVAYTGMQKRTATTVVVDNLKKTTDAILIEDYKGGPIPSDLSTLYAAHPDVEMVYHDTSLPGGLPSYETLDPPQSGKLFYDICQELVDNGLGRGKNDFGAGMVDYISGCHVYDLNYIQINGWNGGFSISNPAVTEERLQEYVDNGAASNPNHPTYRETLQRFMDTLISRFKSQGGTFPVTSFWQPWAGQPSLPSPSSFTQAQSDFCLVATSVKYPDVSYVTSKDDPTPKPGTGCD